MRATLLHGDAGLGGVIWPGDAFVTGDVLAAISWSSLGAEAAGFAVDTAERLWTTAFPDPPPTIRHPDDLEKHNAGVSSIVAAGVHAACTTGRFRVTIDPVTGVEQAGAAATELPTGSATMVGGMVAVPERNALALHDPATMEERTRWTVPPGSFATGPAADGFCPVQFADLSYPMSDSRAGLLDLATGTVRLVPGAQGIRQAPVVIGDVAVVASGPGPGGRVTALDTATGAVRWTVETSPQGIWGPFRDFVPVPIPVLANDGAILVLTLGLSLDLRDPSSGDLLWQVALSDEPTAVAVDATGAWVTSGDHRWCGSKAAGSCPRHPRGLHGVADRHLSHRRRPGARDLRVRRRVVGRAIAGQTATGGLVRDWPRDGWASRF